MWQHCIYFLHWLIFSSLHLFSNFQSGAMRQGKVCGNIVWFFDWHLLPTSFSLFFQLFSFGLYPEARGEVATLTTFFGRSLGTKPRGPEQGTDAKKVRKTYVTTFNEFFLQWLKSSPIFIWAWPEVRGEGTQHQCQFLETKEKLYDARSPGKNVLMVEKVCMWQHCMFFNID